MTKLNIPMASVLTSLALLWSLADLRAQALVRTPPPLPPPLPLPPPPEPKPASTPKPTAFNLSFPGGSQLDLIKAIGIARGKEVNVIIPDEFGEVEIPKLEMENITVPRLFSAITAASQRSEMIMTGRSGFPGPGIQNLQQFRTSYGFRTSDDENSDEAIWYFTVDRPPKMPSEGGPERISQFWHLGRYLEHYSIDDITTAIQTAWRMLGDAGTSTLNYHEDTRLLIAVGPPDRVGVIREVLHQLELGMPQSAPVPSGAVTPSFQATPLPRAYFPSPQP